MREARAYNQAAETVHAGLGRIRSRIRLSLSLRIAGHYCGRLARTFMLAAVIMTLALAVGNVPSILSLAHRVAGTTPDLEGGRYSQLILQDARAEAVLAERKAPEKTDDQVKEFFTVLISGGAPWRPVFMVESGAEDRIIRLTVDLRESLMIWAAAMAGIILTDLLRMISFLRRRKVLDRRVLSPIREMTEIAKTLSAANLSNRINVAGMKYELQDLAMVINSMLDRIEQSYNSQKQFVSDASHELRTPIAVIQGYADMLRRWGKEDPEVLEEGIGAISQETVAMRELVENLLFLARHDKKTLLLEISEFDPAEIVKEVCQEAGMVSGDHRFEMNPRESSRIRADRGMIKQAMRILVDNAVKYSPEDSTVTLGTRPEGKGCVLTVTDRGNGISEKELPKIFERFYRADAARNSETGGHGLGLSICRIIVVAHSGKIRVRSRIGTGTTFEILLPSEPSPGDSPQEEGRPKRRKGRR